MQDSVVPAFRLLLLRHARSGWALPGQRDFDRTLDETGHAEAERIAKAAAERGIRPDLILCSSAARCRQTAEPLHRALGEDVDIRYLSQLYTGPANIYREMVEAHANHACLMLIGHNPMIEELFRHVLGAEQAAALLGSGYPPAGLAIIDFPARPRAGGIWAAMLATMLLPEAEATEGH